MILIGNRGCRVALAAVLLGSLLPARSLLAQATVGIWDLRPWSYTGTTIATSTVNSSGPKVSGLSATSQSSSSIALTGSLDGRMDSLAPVSIAAASTQTETLDQMFALDKPVTFGPLASQSQFNAFAGNNNGVGLLVHVARPDLVTGYTLTLTVTGGGKFNAVNGSFVDSPVITGVGSQTVTLTWTTLTSSVILLNHVEIAGAITSFGASHSWNYQNNDATAVDAQNSVAMIISNAPPEAPLVDVNGRGKIVTAKQTVVLHGQAADANGDILYIEVKVGGKGFRKAQGVTRWQFAARGLRKGRNVVIVRAVDSTGAVSRADRVTILRKR